MLESLFGGLLGGVEVGHVDMSHVVTGFAKTKALVPALGLDPPEGATPQPSDAVTRGPVEYVFRIKTESSVTNPDGILTDPGTERSIPRIQFVGASKVSEPVPIKPGLQAGKLYEFSAVARDVGPVKGIKLADPGGRGNWTPESVQVNRLPSLSGKDQPVSKPDGWAMFKVGKAIGKTPVLFQQAAGGQEQGGGQDVAKA